MQSRRETEARRLARRLAEGKDVRNPLIETVREKLECDEYVNDLKLNVALDRLIDDMFDRLD